MLPQLTKSEFKTFILIYAAYVDYIFTDAEEKYIRSKSSEIDYDNMSALFKAHTDYHSLKIILDHRKKYYKTFQDRAALQAQIIELFRIDGDYSRPEKIFLDFLERLITQTNESESNR